MHSFINRGQSFTNQVCACLIGLYGLLRSVCVVLALVGTWAMSIRLNGVVLLDL